MNKISEEEKEKELAKRLLKEMEKLDEDEAILIQSKESGRITTVRILKNNLEVPAREFWRGIKREWEGEKGWKGIYYLDPKTGKNSKINALEDFFLIPLNSPWGEAARIIARALQFPAMMKVRLIDLKEGVSED